MKFYTNSSSTLNSNIIFTSSGNVGIGTTPPSSRLTINSNGWASIGGNSNPSAKLHVYSEHHEKLEQKFFEIAILLSRETKISSEGLRSIYKFLNDVGYSDDEIISSISEAEKILSNIGATRDLRIFVMDLFIFRVSHIIEHQRETDYIEIFEPLNA